MADVSGNVVRYDQGTLMFKLVTRLATITAMLLVALAFTAPAASALSTPDVYISDDLYFKSGYVTAVQVGYRTDTCVPICSPYAQTFKPLSVWHYLYASPWWSAATIRHNTRVWASVMPGTNRQWSWVWYNTTWYGVQSNRLLVRAATYHCDQMCPIR